MSHLFEGLAPGTRVAVRTRLDPVPVSGPRLTDTVGDLLALDEHTLRVRTRTGEVTLRRVLVTAVRAIPPKPSRRGAPHRAIGIEDLHLVMTQGHPGLEIAWLGAPGQGWLLRAGAGWTGRSNSVLPMGSPGLPLDGAVEAVEAWYGARGLPPRVMLPRPLAVAAADDPLGALLLGRGYRERSITDVLTGRTADLASGAEAPKGVRLTRAERADEAWLTASTPLAPEQLETARAVLALPARQVFLTAHDDEGGVVGAVRMSLNDGWAGIFGLHVASEHRGRGLGRHLTATIAAEALAAAASLAYVQVERRNVAAHRLHIGLGMRAHHAYSYLRP